MSKIQGCSRVNMILAPVIFLGGTILCFFLKGPLIAIGSAGLFLIYTYAYVKVFPKISRYLGYGELRDEK